MNGWKRIGIILSVLWIIGGGFWIRTMVFHVQSQPAIDIHRSCLEHYQLHPGRDCDAEFKADWERYVTNGFINTQTAAFTFGPLLLAWVLFYIIAGLTRWVAAGFRQGS
jgi:hypothetical protein